MSGKIDALGKEFAKQFKGDVLFKGIKQTFEENRLPFSSPRLNYMLHGGLPRGGFYIFLGELDSGKTTSALDLAANAQRIFKEEAKKKSKKGATVEPKKIVFFDIECKLKKDWAERLGLDTDDIYYYPAPAGEFAESVFNKVLKLIETEDVGLVIFDSLGQVVSEKVIEDGMDAKQYGGNSRPITMFSQLATAALRKTNCTFIGINQKRVDFNNPHNLLAMPGGFNLKHSAAAILLFRKGSLIDVKGNEIRRMTETPAGNLVEVFLGKNHIGPNTRQSGFYTLNYKQGVDVYADFVDVCEKLNYVVGSGAWYNLLAPGTGELLEENGKEIKIQGRANVIQYFKDNPAIYDIFKASMEEAIKKVD